MTTACINNFAIQELNNKAAAYMDKGDAETAICRLKSSLDLDPEIYQTHFNLAVAYNTIGKFLESVEESKKVLELKPDFVDAHYTIAVAKEALAYQVLDDEQNPEKAPSDYTLDEISNFINIAQESIDEYNTYLVQKVDAVETDSINSKITELNLKVKDFSRLYDDKSLMQQQEVSAETELLAD